MFSLSMLVLSAQGTLRADRTIRGIYVDYFTSAFLHLRLKILLVQNDLRCWLPCVFCSFLVIFVTDDICLLRSSPADNIFMVASQPAFLYFSGFDANFVHHLVKPIRS